MHAATSIASIPAVAAVTSVFAAVTAVAALAAALVALAVAAVALATSVGLGFAAAFAFSSASYPAKSLPSAICPSSVVIGHLNHPAVTSIYHQLLDIIVSRGLRTVTLNDVFDKPESTRLISAYPT